MLRTLRYLIPAVLALLVVWLAWPYLQSDQRQVEKVHRKLITQAAKRNWVEAEKFLAEDYTDQWELDRAEAIPLAAELFQGFLYLNIEWETTEVTVNDGIAKVRGIAKMNGSGGGLSTTIMNKVNALEEPWVFTWRKQSKKPDSWKLVSVRNDGLKNIGL
ncbi:MAG TPA: hypothetical protein VLE43_08865 [Candidatus Saccharimonadia bacterium]|nr:hypothetical protein [Candidatus Saccharimonadia bacterium]